MNNSVSSARIITIRGIQSADCITIPCGVSLCLPAGNTWGFLWCVNGSLTVKLGDRRLEFEEGGTCLFSPLTNGFIKNSSNSSYFLVRFECFYDPLKTLSEMLCTAGEQSRVLLNMMLDIVRSSETVSAGEWHYTPGISETFGDEQLLIDLLEELLILRLRQSRTVGVIKNGGYRRDLLFHDLIIERVNNYVAEHISEKISVDDIARSMNYSRQHLSTLYKNGTGRSINEFITGKKIEASKKLFSGNAVSVSDISEQLGFSSPQYFCRVFQKITGTSPTEYIRVQRESEKEKQKKNPPGWGAKYSSYTIDTVTKEIAAEGEISSGELYKGICGDRFSSEELIEFLDDAFETNETGFSMLSVAPKLFKYKYRPTDHNYIIADRHRIRAAVGAYPLSINVSGTILSALLIGNISVYSSHRLNSYVNECMEMTIKGVLAEKPDFAILNGQTQRFAFYGFEMGGTCGMFMVDRRNLEQLYNTADAPEGFSVVKFTPENQPLLDEIRRLFESQPSYTVRPAEKFSDILTGWQGTCYGVYSPEDEFAGYFIHNGNYSDAVNEIMCTREEFGPAMIRMSYAVLNEPRVIYMVPEYQRIMYDLLSDVAAKCDLTTTNNFCVFNYQRVLDAALKLRNGVYGLKDGTVTVRIDGIVKTERLRIEVLNGISSVTEYEGVCEYNFSHRQAMKLFFGLTSKERRILPTFAQSWFQLPLFIHFADND